MNREDLLSVLRTRFEQNETRHEAIEWAEVQERLEEHAGKLWSLQEISRLRIRSDRRHPAHTVFLYHNGAQSYYAARGFRGSLRV